LTKVDSSTNDASKKTWKEKMEEIISRSKKAKVNHFGLLSICEHNYYNLVKKICDSMHSNTLLYSLTTISKQS